MWKKKLSPNLLTRDSELANLTLDWDSLQRDTYVNASTQMVFIIWLIVFNFLAWAPWLFKRHT